jgi:hypothetical protein
MRIPSRITAGDTVTWSELAPTDPTRGQLSAPDWALTFAFRGPVAVSGSDVQGVATGTGWTVTLPSALTTAMNQTGKPARWYWQAYATKGADRVTVGDGVLQVGLNLAGVTGTVDCRSTAEQLLSQIDATLLARTTGTAVAEYTIGSRSLKYMAATELLELRSRYQMVVRNERRRQALKNGLGAPDRIGIRFK